MDGKTTIKSQKNLGEILWNRDDQDFVIQINGKILKIHKCVIAAKSPVFDRMFLSGLKESKENKVEIIDFNFQIVEIAMKFCYGIEISESLNVDVGSKLLQFSDKYDIDDLKTLMETYLFSKRLPWNICEIVNASIISNSPQLKLKCFIFMERCMKEKITVENLEILDKDFALNLLKAAFTL